MLMNIHNAPTKGNFCNQQKHTMKPIVVEDYNCHMDYVDKGDGMANSHSISTQAHGRGQRNCSSMCKLQSHVVKTKFHMGDS